MTAHDLIHAAARAINAVASGEELPGPDLQDALVVLNHFMDSLGAERATVFSIARQVFSLVAGQQTYTMGTGGNFNVPRPPRIQYASIISNANPAFPVELEKRELLSDKEWQEIRVKNTTSSLPTRVYDGGEFPLRNISVWPIPQDSTPQIALYTWTALSQFALDGTDYTFPPGYLEGIKYNLAKRLNAEWPGTILTPMAAQLATEGMARIKKFNAVAPKLKCDISTGEGDRYNWLTDEMV